MENTKEVKNHKLRNALIALFVLSPFLTYVREALIYSDDRLVGLYVESGVRTCLNEGYTERKCRCAHTNLSKQLTLDELKAMSSAWKVKDMGSPALIKYAEVLEKEMSICQD